MNKLIPQLSILAILEGISYLLLFVVTMPLKYYMGYDLPNKIVGMVHGVLFVAYCIWVVLVARQLNWSIKTTLLCLAASLFPFATFIVDVKLLRPLK